jgi:biopolymer transport protein ExbD
MTKRPLAVLLLAGLCAAAAGSACRKAPRKEETAAPSQDPHIKKVWVTKDGVIQLDGKVADFAAVEQALSEIAKRDGVVFYGREAAREQPHPNAAKIVELIASLHLPVRLSSKPDFSDEITPGE